MLRMLRFDLYKIFKSKALLSAFIITLCIAFLDPLFGFTEYDPNFYMAFLARLNQISVLHISIWIFVVPFVAKDFSSKYIKNIYSTYSAKDKIYYILSKAIYIFALCVICFLVRFLACLFTNLIQSAVLKVDFMFEDAYIIGGDLHVLTNTSQGLYQYFCHMMNCFARGTVFLFLCMLLKKEYFVIIIILPYGLFLSGVLYDAINNAIYSPEVRDFLIQKFTVFGMPSVLRGTYGERYMLELTECLLVSLGYGVLFTGASWLCFFKRSF